MLKQGVNKCAANFKLTHYPYLSLAALTVFYDKMRFVPPENFRNITACIYGRRLRGIVSLLRVDSGAKCRLMKDEHGFAGLRWHRAAPADYGS